MDVEFRRRQEFPVLHRMVEPNAGKGLDFLHQQNHRI